MPKNNTLTSPPNSFLTATFLADTNFAGNYTKYNFLDGSFTYLGMNIKQEFNYFLIDNIGTGSIRFCINRPDISMVVPVYGAKTLKPGDAIYFEENVWHISIYYAENSSVEIILKSE